jgi:hypothetical protein
MTATPTATRPTATDLKRTTGTTRRSEDDRIVALFGFPGLTHLSEALDRHRAAKDPRGRKAHFPALALLATAACARITGSQAAATTALKKPELWARCQEAFYALTEVELPDRPPTLDHVREFRKQVTQRTETLDDLSEAFTAAATGQARHLGNLARGVAPDWAEPDEAHVIFGDGTIVARYSDAEVIVCPVTGRKILTGSRAKDPKSAKIQREFRISGADDKNSAGINHVGMHTRTEYGPIVLATDIELGAEQWTALDLLDRVVRHAGDGVHTLVYDGAVTGWAVEYAMARHGIQVMGKIPAASSKTDAHRYSQEQIDHYVATVAREKNLEARGRVDRLLRSDILGQMYRGERPTAIGTSIYPSTTAECGYEVVYSSYLFTTARHDTAHGPCEHTLVLDDGALFTVTVDPVSELLVKDEHLPAISSVRNARSGGAWGTTTHFLVPCQTGDFEWTYTWTPAPTRHTRDSARQNRSPADPFGWRLRTTPRLVRDHHRVVTRARNDSESLNKAFKDTLPSKRGASIHAQGQRLDYLLFGVMRNSDTWLAYTQP